MNNRCPICGGVSTLHHHLKNSPVLQNIFFGSEIDALNCNKVNVYFYFCNTCIFLFNPDFKEMEVTYNIDYNNDQLASEIYRKYISNISNELVSKCNLNSTSKILEIGCGNGFFLKKIMEATSSAYIVGFDPAYNDQHGLSDVIKKDYFKKDGYKYDVVILRHCFDSFVNNKTLMKDIGDSLTESGRVYIEATSLDCIIGTGNFSMLFHEYHSYYSILAISIALKKFNLVVEQAFPLLDGNYIGVVAKKYSCAEFDLNSLNLILKNYKKVVIWGISGRAVSLLSQLSLNVDTVQYGVDINKKKQGQYIPVTGQKIISPNDAIKFEPDLVIVSNKYYAKEIMSLFSNDKEFVTFDGKFLRR